MTLIGGLIVLAVVSLVSSARSSYRGVPPGRLCAVVTRREFAHGRASVRSPDVYCSVVNLVTTAQPPDGSGSSEARSASRAAVGPAMLREPGGGSPSTRGGGPILRAQPGLRAATARAALGVEPLQHPRSCPPIDARRAPDLPQAALPTSRLRLQHALTLNEQHEGERNADPLILMLRRRVSRAA